MEDRETLDAVGPYGLDRAQLLKRLGLGAAALSIPAFAAAEDALGGTASHGGKDFIQKHPRWRFVFINHVTTNPFFVPTQYGIQDAASLLGVTYQWTGSAKSDVGEMVNSMNAAISAKADGIAVAIIDKRAFNGPTQRALRAGIPVVSYNADGGVGNNRHAYIGQDLFLSGVRMGERAASLVKGGKIGLFIATPGSANIQPRIDGALSVLRKAGKYDIKVVATGADVNEELAKIDAWYQGNKDAKGMFAVDAGSTQGVGQTMKKYRLHAKGVRGGGYDLLPTTLRLISEGHLDFTIDQQPYLQGFIPMVQLFFYRYSSGLVAPSDTNTGLLFVTKSNVRPYLTTKTRYEGSSTQQKYPVS